MHRDVKPENMFLDENDNIRLGDAGLACRIGQNPERISGTFSFMAPEQFDTKPYGSSVDIWALGLSIHFLFTYVCSHKTSTKNFLVIF